MKPVDKEDIEYTDFRKKCLKCLILPFSGKMVDRPSIGGGH